MRMVSKLDLAVALAVFAGGVILIERTHRIVIEPPAPEEATAATACPDNDTVPYSATCLAFLGRGYALRMNWQANAAESAEPTGGPQ